MLSLFRNMRFVGAIFLLSTAFSFVIPSVHGMQNAEAIKFNEELNNQLAEQKKALSDVLLDIRYFLVKMVASPNIVDSEKMAVAMEKKVEEAQAMSSKATMARMTEIASRTHAVNYEMLNNGGMNFYDSSFKWLEGLASLIKKTRADPISARVEAVQNYMKSQDKE